MTSPRSQFQSPDSTQTLAQGLAEYYSVNPQLKRGDDLSLDAREFFRCHDVVHVLYGCGTSMPDEAVVKLSSVFGTTGGFSILRGYRLHESLEIYLKLPIGSSFIAFLSAPYLIARTLWRCSRQPAKWPWSNHEQYLHTALRELRTQFGIRVAHVLHTSAA